MTVSAISAAKAICEASDWSVSNLALQKILYIAHMVHYGRTGQPLIDESFEAWDYGPVVPAVYHRAKAFGSDPVGNVFHGARPIEDERALKVIEQTVASLKDKHPGDLVEITHWDGGAWSKHYPKGRNQIIPHDDIFREYIDRVNP
ncbi:Panacea domain-containing protein [Thioalkalivibrio sp. ALJ8]|uniref:Panacea domain-containing protein n=1 Tax=Thioalkalivibrio sp. ALJ8 TaxID=1158757 RepID=UPI000371807D|nr:type II toxin-antitoxin system antitoxin SocA domain-containing protein [Thioalkalivibrio sp. ALJ8]